MESETPHPEGRLVSAPSPQKPCAALLVSLVVPTHNRCASLRMVLEGLEHQTTSPEQFEVLVICDGCTDDSVAMCHASQVSYALHVIDLMPNQGPAAARNRGVDEASAPLILFIDDDVVPEPTLIAEHLRLHTQDERAVVIGPLLAPPDLQLNPWTSWEEAMLDKQYLAMSAHEWEPTPRQFYTGNASVRRAHIQQAGGFDPTFRRAEDVELAFRFHDLGLRFYFNPEAKGWHYVQRSLRSWLNISTAYGVADVAMYRDGRPVMLFCMADDFHKRQVSLQRLAKVCVGKVWLVSLTAGLLLVIARLASWMKLRRGAYAAYSAIFNLRYWQSVSSQLGGAPAFWKLIWQRQGTIS